MATPLEARAPAAAPQASGGVREVGRLAYPIVLTQMSQTVMHVVDSIFVGRLGAAELGALGFSGVWLWTVFSVFSGTANGVQTFVSQAWGGGDDRSCGRWAWQGLYAVVPAALLAVLAFVAVAEPLWRVLGATPEVREHALDYARTRPIGFAGLAVWMVLAGLGFTVMAVAIKLLGTRLDSFQVAFFRILFGFVVILPIVGYVGAGTNWDFLRTRHLHVHAIRGLLGMIAMYCSYYALARIDLATHRNVPWDGGVDFFLGEFVTGPTDKDGPFPLDPRQVLKRVLARAAKLGVQPMCSLEFEFFNFAETPQSWAEKKGVGPQPISPGMFGYSLLRAHHARDYMDALFAVNELAGATEVGDR